MKKSVSLLAALLVALTLTVVAFADTFNGTMVRPNNADPNLFFYNGKYYMTQTGTSRIAIFETEHVDDLATLELSKNISYTAYLNGKVYDPAVTELFGEGATINGTWSPELHYFSEAEFPGNSGWYMFLGLRKNTGDSSMVRMVVLKSMTDSPKGPYGHPTYNVENYSQPVLDTNGNVWDEWACGQTTLTIPEGPYKGTYAMWVAEEGRGQSGATGQFYQKIMIAKMKSPWQFDGEPGIVTTPTQNWEYAGASSTHPRVVEGATPVYGKNGEVFITYSGSGYWSDYGLGQLTWNGGDPLKASSWVKLSESLGNPIFSAVDAENIRGAGHASFLTDTDGNGFICYHAYAYENGKKASSRDAYIEPYYIDYTKWNGVSYGVITIGLDENGIPADSASKVTFATDGEYLTAPEVYALGRTFSVTLNMVETDAEGFIIYKSTDGKVFEYLATTVGTQYVDSDVTEGETYYYRAYAYREEEISPVSETVSCKAETSSPYTESAVADGSAVTVTVHAQDNYDSVRLYRSTDGKNFGTHIQEIENVKYGETLEFVDRVTKNGTYYYVAFATNGGYEYFSNFIVSATVDVQVSAPEVEATLMGELLVFEVTPLSEYDDIILYSSSDNINFVRKANIDDLMDFDGILEQGGKYFYVSVREEGTYYYYLTAVKDGIESNPGETIMVKVVFIVPPTVSLSVNEGKVHITATANDDYDSMTIVRIDATPVEDNDSGFDFVGTADVLSTSGPVKSGETFDFCDENTICGNTYYYCAQGFWGDVISDSSNQIEFTAEHYHILTEEEIPATTTSVGKTAVYTCRCGDSYGGDEIPMLPNEDEFTMSGDADGDGTVNMLDVLRVLKAAVGEKVEINTANADIDGNGKITVSDVLAILVELLNTK